MINASTAGAGGTGTANDISGESPTPYYAGGGGGGIHNNSSGTVGAGGNGGGGAGGHGSLTATSGTANTGGGGGGSPYNVGVTGNGGSGIVIISYTSPLNVVDGSIFYETDTNKSYVLNSGTWTEV
jgi:hypothetical protein